MPKASPLVLLASLLGALIDCGSSSTMVSPVPDATVETGSSLDATPDVHLDDARVDVPVVPSDEPPPIATGLDALRLWERWPYLRIGARTYLRSTYDRAGGNEAADASHFLRTTGPAHHVALDVVGTGTLEFVRTNHWHGSPWHYVLDGRDTVVSESSTADPDHPIAGSVFLPTALFPSPLALTWSEAKGADVSWVPLPFRDSLELAYERTFYGTGYFIYTLFDDGATFTRPFAAWDGATAPSPDVLSLLAHAGEDQAPSGDGVTVTEGRVAIPASGAVQLAALEGPTTLRVLRLSIPLAAADALATARLRVTWDDHALPSIDVPVPLFFGAGNLRNFSGRPWLVKSLPAAIRVTDADRLELSSYFPMPFRTRAKLELVGGDDPIDAVEFHLRSEPYRDPPTWVGELHATYHDLPTPKQGEDDVFLDTAVDEGGGDWCGHVVGTAFVFTDRLGWRALEGDPRFFFDDSRTPQAQGTGSEEWGGGGDYWDGGQQSTLPFAGHPTGAPGDVKSPPVADQVESEYRWLLSDAMPFGKRARVQFEHGGIDEMPEHYRSATFWYGNRGACLVPTDALHVGDAVDEAAHRYVSPDASAPETVSSRYELGVDHFGTTEIYPEESDTGRHTTGTSELTLQIRPDNFGVLLRRKLDDSLPDQRAEVWIADDVGGASFERAGTWYLAGSNRCVFLSAATETGLATPRPQTSNRRWRDDEFIVPRRFTRGRKAIRVRLVHVALDQPLVPDEPAPARAWSEFRYTAYAWILPTDPG